MAAKKLAELVNVNYSPKELEKALEGVKPSEFASKNTKSLEKKVK
jgi:hypothetical protein